MRVKRRGADEKELAIRNGQVHSYDPESPWQWVFDELVGRGESDWWRKELEYKCFMVKTKVRELGEYIEGDQPVQASTSSTSTTSPAVAPPPPDRHPEDRRPRPRRQNVQAQADNNEWGMGPATPVGMALHDVNKRGQHICKGYQRGQCTATDPMSRCLQDGVSLHICARCFDNRHGAFFPNPCARPLASIEAERRGTKRRR